MRAAATIAGYALRESLRRRVFLVVLILTLGFLALYALGAVKAFEETRELAEGSDLVEENVIAGSTLLGLAIFTTMFLGVVLAVFLTLGAVRRGGRLRRLRDRCVRGRAGDHRGGRPVVPRPPGGPGARARGGRDHCRGAG